MALRQCIHTLLFVACQSMQNTKIQQSNKELLVNDAEKQKRLNKNSSLQVNNGIAGGRRKPDTWLGVVGISL